MSQRRPGARMEAVPAAVLVFAALGLCAATLEWGAAGVPLGLGILALGWILAMELDDRHRW